MIIYVEIGQQSIAADVAERYEYNNNQVNAIHGLVVEGGGYKMNVTET